MAKSQSADIFLSYSFKDRPWVSEFVSALKDAGIKAWDASEITPGERWKDKIQKALRDSSTLIILLSRNSIESRWTFFEIGAAVAGKKRIIPVLTEDIDMKNLPPLLTQFQVLKESSPKEAGRRVAEAIEIGEKGES